MSEYIEIDNGSEKVIQWNDNGVIRFIPIDLANSDYQKYLKSLDEAATL
jgi:hypothetical protein